MNKPKDLLQLVTDFQNGDQEALLALLESKYIASTLKSLYHGRNNYNPVTSQYALEKEEILSESFLVLSNRLKNFKADFPQQVTSFVTKTLVGHINDLARKRYKRKECTYTDTHERYALDNEYQEFENETVDSIDNETSPVSRIMNQFPFLCAYFVHNKTYEQISQENHCSKAHAWRVVQEEFEESKEYLGNVLPPEELGTFKKHCEYDTR